MSGAGYGKKVGKINLQGYVDIRDVAALAAFFLEQKRLPVFRYADIIHETFQIVLVNLKLQGKLKDMSVAEAKEYLKEAGFSLAQLEGGKRGQKIRGAETLEILKEDGLLDLTANPEMLKYKAEADEYFRKERESKSPQSRLELTPELREAMGSTLADEEYAPVSQSDEGERLVTSMLPPGLKPVAPKDNLDERNAPKDIVDGAKRGDKEND